jgi:ComF family protein
MGQRGSDRDHLDTADGRMRLAHVISRVQSAIRLSSDAVLSVVLSPSCAACGELLLHPTRGPICSACWASILPLTPPLCERCGDPLPTWRVVSLPLACCARCRRLPRLIDRARAIGAYDGALRAVVHALKYEGRRSLARPLGRMMRERGADILEGAACAIPVPLHPSRRRHRGFNQAADLAGQMRIPVASALRRVRATPTQTGLPAGRRHGNVRDAFAATRAAAALTGTVVVLIDDVSTTGATLDACARALKRVGVAEVRALTAARVVGRLTAED